MKTTDEMLKDFLTDNFPKEVKESYDSDSSFDVASRIMKTKVEHSLFKRFISHLITFVTISGILLLMNYLSDKASEDRYFEPVCGYEGIEGENNTYMKTYLSCDNFIIKQQ